MPRAIAATLFVSILALVVTPVVAQETYFYIDSEPGDFVGQGQTLLIPESDGDFTVSRNFDNGVRVFIDADPGGFWTLDFAAAFEVDLAPGLFEGATRFPFQDPSEPGLSVFGQGRGCNQLTGRFTVLEAVYDGGGEVVSFAANFEQHCEGGIPALFGAIRINSTVPGPTFGLNVVPEATELAPGDTLRASLFADNLPGSGNVDLYFGVILPDGDRIRNFTNFDLRVVRARLSDATSLRPIRAGVPLGAPFARGVTPVIERLVNGNEPPGTYQFWLAAAVPGSFDDGTIDEGDLLAESRVEFTITP